MTNYNSDMKCRFDLLADAYLKGERVVAFPDIDFSVEEREQNEGRGYHLAMTHLEIRFSEKIDSAYFTPETKKVMQELLQEKLMEVTKEFLEAMIGMDLENKFEVAGKNF